LKWIKKIIHFSSHSFSGLDGAGKSTVVAKILGLPTEGISPTFGFCVKTLERFGCFVSLWDIGGQATIRSYWRNYYEETDGVIWVVDSADVARLQQVKEELQSVLQEERLQGASLLLLANKQDLPNAMNEEEMQKILDVNSLKHSHEVYLVKCSSILDSQNQLQEALDWLLKEIASRLFYFSNADSSSTIITLEQQQ
jgi:ADP-ribosylation factor-like protein 2